MNVANLLGISLAVALLTACGGASSTGSGSVPPPTPTPTPTPPPPVVGVTQSAAIAVFARPWAIKALADGRFLVTQRNATGALSIVTQAGLVTAVSGLPITIGLLDVALDPAFSSNRIIYFTAMVRDTTAPRVGRAAADPTLFPERMVAFRALLQEGAGTAQLLNVTEIFRQVPTIVTFAGSGEPGGRMAFAADGSLFITSGDRQELDSAFLFSLDNNLGKVVRILPDGRVPADNPYASTPGARPEIWTRGHRNHYGLAFAPDGNLWSSEQGPMGGDEFNLIRAGSNYGWPAVSNGSFYDGGNIPDHAPGDGYFAPAISWTPVIAPGGMIFYRSDIFGAWRGDAILTGFQSRGLVRVRVVGETASEVQRLDLGARIRDIVEAPDGSLFILTDGDAGELRKISPVF
jgi:glucose/arabinose dehydrogenase